MVTFRYVVFAISLHMKVLVQLKVCLCASVCVRVLFVISDFQYFQVMAKFILRAQHFLLLFFKFQYQPSLKALLVFQRLFKYGSLLELNNKCRVQFHYLTNCPSIWTALLCQFQCVFSHLSIFLGPFHPVSSRKKTCAVYNT